MTNNTTTAGATATVATNPICGLTGCEVKVGRGGLCTGCRFVYFCSKEHQRRDWPSHKLRCLPVTKGETLGNPVKREVTEEEVNSIGLGVGEKGLILSMTQVTSFCLRKMIRPSSKIKYHGCIAT